MTKDQAKYLFYMLTGQYKHSRTSAMWDVASVAMGNLSTDISDDCANVITSDDFRTLGDSVLN